MFSKTNFTEKAAYVRDFVFASNDGIITTFAVVAGAQGANLNPKIVIVLGVANLLADGISMAAGSYLSLESETDYRNIHARFKIHTNFLAHAGITFASFVIAGFIPLLPYIFSSTHMFIFSLAMVVIALMGLGVVRSITIGKNYGRSILETSLIGTTAAVLAYGVGALLESIVK